MVKKMFRWVLKFRNISLLKYIYLNYFCGNIVREKGCHIIPYRNSRIELRKNCKICLSGNNMEIGVNKIKGSKAETLVRLKDGAVWNCKNGCRLVYNSVLEVHENALLDTGFFYMNSYSVIVCTKHITIGEDVWMGRNIIIYDSDYHQIRNSSGQMTNHSKPVVLGNHVWLTNQVMVMKGVHIGEGAVITPFSVIKKDIPANCLAGNKYNVEVFKNDINWSSERVTDWGYIEGD